MKTIVTLLVFAGLALAQAPDWSTGASSAKALQNQIKNNVIKSADKMTAENFDFKATDAVRSYGAILAHIADAQNNFCAASLGEKNPAPGIEKSKKTKEEISAALKESFAYCDKAYAALTDANANESVKFFRGERARLGVLIFNTMHTWEHYGNLVTYMRLKGIVPPSSER